MDSIDEGGNDGISKAFGLPVHFQCNDETKMTSVSMIKLILPSMSGKFHVVNRISYTFDSIDDGA